MRTLAALALALLPSVLPAATGVVPRPAPSFSARTATGTPMPLGQFKGKVVVVEFLLTTCPHCQDTSRVLERLYKQYGAQGFQPVGIAINDNASALIPGFVRDNSLTFPVGFVPASEKQSVYDYLQLSVMDRMMMPQLVFIDRNGTIQAQYPGDDPFLGPNQEMNIRGMVEKMLKPAAAVKAAPVKKALAGTKAK